MIPRIDKTSEVQSLYLEFLQALQKTGFQGEIAPDYANRTVLATDNSIYQVLPQGVVYPKDIDDLITLAQLAGETRFRKIVLSARGGGTGTNGQSLTDGVVVDISKHMNQILEINAEERWVRVQTGVVKDQLNAALKPYGLFFAPELSTSNRATIGGMINTDASGQGSCLYGKTRDHVIELSSVLLDGDVLYTKALQEEERKACAHSEDKNGLIHRLVDNIQQENQALIEQKFPKLNRCLTGYDLAHIRDEKNQLNLNNILCGSEGTLGFIAEAKLNVLPIPKHSSLVIVYYGSFDAALRDAPTLMQANPTSIETIDSKILELAMNDIVWHSVAEFFAADNLDAIRGINLVEYTGDTLEELEEKIKVLSDGLDTLSLQSLSTGYGIASGSAAVKKVWGMRKKAVGLLGNMQGEARPIPFVEDTAVPPESLADFIQEFRAILDSYELTYGMFGHVDAGVLHVRPALDMKDPQQEKLVREISDKVAALTQQYNGLLWGEHGKGVRSEYAPTFFGELYPQLQRIKATFDPHNQLNPGKIATPSQKSQLLKIDKVPTRGAQDRIIPTASWEAYSEAVYCNGNGACYNWDFNDAMCPSWKVTRQRVHSPKGRASLIKEWVKQVNKHGGNPVVEMTPNRRSLQKVTSSFIDKIKNQRSKARDEYDFSHEVYDAMAGCLSCKSCSGQCPIKVDVPEFRSKFIALYHTRYFRPLRDHLVANLEPLLPHLEKVSGLYNFLMGLSPVKYILERFVGFVDSPTFSKLAFNQALAKLNVPIASEAALNKIKHEDKAMSPVIVLDAFTRFFETEVVIDFIALLVELGFKPLVAPYKPNGKPLHVHGFLPRFKDTAAVNARALGELAKRGLPLIGIDPAMTLVYRSEYKKVLNDNYDLTVELPQEFLARHSQTLNDHNARFEHGSFRLLPHCTEKTNAAGSIADWSKIFAALGQNLDITSAGCCGMSGTYGHEARNKENSKSIFQLSWAKHVEQNNPETLLATGYSCRSQTKREANKVLKHPFQALLAQIRSNNSTSNT